VIPLSSTIVATDLLRQATGQDGDVDSGPFQPEHHEDYGLWLRLFSLRPQLRYRCLRAPLMAYRLHADSVSAQRWRSHRAVSRLLAQHSRHRLHRALLLGRWAGARMAVQLLEAGPAGRKEPLSAVYSALLEPP
jgi:hypothetical protein